MMQSILSQAATQAAHPQPSLLEMLLPFIGVLFILWLLMLRPRAAEQKKIEAMLAGLKKGDRVVTVGGIIGTVVNLSNGEVTLKVDESTNTKMTFIRGAIKSVVSGTLPGK